MPTDNPKLNPSDQMQIAGIDYGSKRAGTTALALLETGASLQLYQSGKGEDADAFLLKHLRQRQPTKVFMDAPYPCRASIATSPTPIPTIFTGQQTANCKP